jgi:hypothetical protein
MTRLAGTLTKLFPPVNVSVSDSCVTQRGQQKNRRNQWLIPAVLT